MPLTKVERDFLDAYVFEATNDAFGGPATEDLARRGIGYLDIHWVLTAYHREYSAEKKWTMGTHNPNPPPSPWASLEEAQRRNQELREEWEPRIRGESVITASQTAAEPELG